jgi:tRNA G10  N-methylase Trm11
MGLHTYYFLLGASQDLAYEELKLVVAAQFPQVQIEILNPPFAQVTSLQALPVEQLQAQLGGSVKIGQTILFQKDAATSIATDLKKSAQRRFTLSAINTKYPLETVAKSIKHEAQSLGHVVSYRLAKSAYLSVSMQNSLEYCIHGDEIIKILTMQDIEAWNRRDYGRPNIDAKSGMLPPKIARMLVNLALPHNQQAVLYDPFCGSGTILAEALVSGHQVYGSDISAKAVHDSNHNLQWLTTTFALEPRFYVTHQDVHHAQLPSGVLADAIVFEGYLGPPNIRQEQIANQLKGMNKLYLGAFKRLKLLLKDEGIIVAALPAYVSATGVKTLDALIDRVGELGYTPILPVLEYGRPTATIKRRIYRLKKE